MQCTRLRPADLRPISRIWCRSYHFDLLDLKVGLIQKVDLHPQSDKLYISQIQLGSDGPIKQVCSGLREFLPRESLINQLVVVANNMKKCKLRGERSEAMILCGDNGSTVRLCKPHERNIMLLGANIVLEGSADQNAPTRIIKRKEWEDIASRLYVGDNGKVTYREEDGAEKLLLVQGSQTPIIVQNMPKGCPVR